MTQVGDARSVFGHPAITSSQEQSITWGSDTRHDAHYTCLPYTTRRPIAVREPFKGSRTNNHFKAAEDVRPMSSFNSAAVDSCLRN
jgi:hypothetical protein